MNYQEIKDIYKNLDAETRWMFLFGLFGYRYEENHGLRRFFKGKYTWYRPDGKRAKTYPDQKLPFMEFSI